MKINELVLKNRFVVEDGPVPPIAEPAAAPATKPAVAPAAKPAAATTAQPTAKGSNLWQKLKAGVAGAAAGYSASQSQRAGSEATGKTASLFIDRWNQAIGQDPSLNTPEQLQAYMTNSTKKSGITVPPAPAQLNPVVTAKYITDVTGKSLAAGRLGLAAPADEKSATAAPAAATGPAVDQGVSVTSENPMVLNYKGQDYAINDQGQWSKANNQKAVLSQTMQAFLDKQEKAILDYKPPSAPQAQAQQPAAPQAQTQQTAAPSTDQAAMDRLSNITEPKPAAPSYVSGTQVTPTTATQKIPSTVAATPADKLIDQYADDPAKLQAMLDALQGTPA